MATTPERQWCWPFMHEWRRWGRLVLTNDKLLT